jgi:hypothetical protein
MEDKKESKYSKILSWLDSALIYAFWIFVTLYRILIVQLIWNELAPKHLGFNKVSFAGVLLIQLLFKYLIIGNMLADIKNIKRIQCVSFGIKPSSTTTENWTSFIETTIIMIVSWFLVQVGLL